MKIEEFMVTRRYTEAVAEIRFSRLLEDEGSVEDISRK